MKKNFISLLFVSAITVGLLSACSSAPADDNATNPKTETVTSQANHDTNSSPVSVTLNEVAHSIFYAPQYVAIENGYFADEGINLTLVTGLFYPQSLANIDHIRIADAIQLCNLLVGRAVFSCNTGKRISRLDSVILCG